MESFWQLADVHADGGIKTVLGVVRTNGLPVDLEEGDAIGVYPTVSRFNHSCDHNVHNSWQADLGSEVLYATRDIEEGEELCITYVDVFQTREERQAELARVFRFDCCCDACCFDEDARAVSDGNRRKLQQLREVLPQSQHLAGRVVAKMVEIIDAELQGSPPAKCCVYHMGYQAALECHDRAAAAEMARRAWEQSVLSEGPGAWRSRMLQECAAGSAAPEAVSFAWGGEGVRAS